MAIKVGFCQGVFQFVEVLAACCQQTLPQLRLQRSGYRVTNICQKASRHPRLPNLRFQQEDVNDMASHRMKYENGIEPYSMKTICALNVPLHSATCGSRDAMTADQTHMCRSVDRFEADLVYPNRSIHDKHGTPWMLAFPILGTNPTKKKVLLARLLHPQ